MQKTIVIIPCYNESRRLNLPTFESFLKDNLAVSLLFVDDGSSDKTLEIINNLSENYENAHALRLGKNGGKAEAIRQAFLYVKLNFECDLIGYFDADLSTTLDYINRFHDVFLKNQSINLVMGARIRRLGATISRNPLRHFFGRIVATIASSILKLPVYDTQCGAKLFRMSYIDDIFDHRFETKWLFDIEILFRLIKKHGNDAVMNCTLEFPLEKWIDEGNSKIKIKDFLLVPYYLLRITSKYRN